MFAPAIDRQKMTCGLQRKLQSNIIIILTEVSCWPGPPVQYSEKDSEYKEFSADNRPAFHAFHPQQDRFSSAGLNAWKRSIYHVRQALLSRRHISHHGQAHQ